MTSKPNGFMGKILKVDLSTGRLKVESLSKEVAKKYLGGKGYSVYLLYRYLKEFISMGIHPAEIDLLGPENVLIFSTGTGTGISSYGGIM
ncbi:MAG: aldehyde ferredoxin oxidoreductase N-terminal domain-containing protein [Candidatus Bathyarchaeia archaeon]